MHFECEPADTIFFLFPRTKFIRVFFASDLDVGKNIRAFLFAGQPISEKTVPTRSLGKMSQIKKKKKKKKKECSVINEINQARLLQMCVRLKLLWRFSLVCNAAKIRKRAIGSCSFFSRFF